MKALHRRTTVGARRRFREFDIELDKGLFGSAWLKDSRIAAVVIRGLKDTEEKGSWRLHAWVVMSNHVHVLFEPRAPLRTIVQAVKGRTAREANLLFGRVGNHFGQSESFDHWIRNVEELERVRSYIERNPVVAGLVQRPEDWPWSSAGERSRGAGV